MWQRNDERYLRDLVRGAYAKFEIIGFLNRLVGPEPENSKMSKMYNFLRKSTNFAKIYKIFCENLQIVAKIQNLQTFAKIYRFCQKSEVCEKFADFCENLEIFANICKFCARTRRFVNLRIPDFL